jgi:N-acetylmuramic acid 6-phosphate etherase
VAEFIDAAFKGFKHDGRLIYVGAGTSGRLGVLDASECPPTFGVAPTKVVGVIAGGSNALKHAIEGAEDNTQQALNDMEALQLTPADSVVGISASGTAPYVVEALRYARSCGCVTAGILNSQPAPLLEVADYALVAITGPEPITGSTRMKAGTAQKLLLNHISTGLMILLGKTYGNLMVDVRPTNSKLHKRAIRLVMQLAHTDETEATQLLNDCQWEVKTAIVKHLTHGSVSQARDALAHHQGRLKATLESLSSCR